MSVATKSQVKVTKYGGLVGAMVSGVDLSRPLDDESFAAIHAAIDEHGVIILEGQERMSKADFVAFGKRFGDLWVGNGYPADPEVAEMQTVIKEAKSRAGTGEIWHMDQTFVEHPHRWTMLHAIELPPYGGDTCFLSLAAAFDFLSDGMKEMLRGLKTVHWRPQFARMNPSYDANRSNDTSKLVDELWVHPAVTRHPVTGRELLNINPAYSVRFDGWTEEDSKPLFKQIMEAADQFEFQCRYKWKLGALVLWDNRQVWHSAVNDYHGHRRELRRVMVK